MEYALEKQRRKCGEIFILQGSILEFTCVLCDAFFQKIDDFLSHIKVLHLNDCAYEDKEYLDQNDDRDDGYKLKTHNVEKNAEYLKTEIKEEGTNILDKDEAIEPEFDLINDDWELETDSVEPNVEESEIENVKEQDPISVEDKSNETTDEPIETVLVGEKPNIFFSNESTQNTSVEFNPKIGRRKKGPPNLYCEACEVQFQKQITYDKHLMVCRVAVEHAKNLASGGWIKHDSNGGNLKKPDPFKCLFCERRFKTRLYCIEHECTHTGEKLFKCETCGKCFRKKGYLSLHMRIHDSTKIGIYKCHICAAAFTHPATLKLHLRRHLGEKPYKCEYCDKRFVGSTEKKLHERLHTGEKPFQCSHCGKRFSSGSTWNDHVKTHSKEKTVKCTHCDKYFSSSKNMRRHASFHAAVKKHKCQQCDAEFHKRYLLITHEKLHLNKKEYVCTVCGKGYNQKVGLRAHTKKNHPKP